MSKADLIRIIGKIEDLPTLPRTVLKITELVNNPKSSARDLSRIITDDQVLTARLLRLVNSSFYGFPQRISTVTGAIVLLGFDAIRNLLLTTSVMILDRSLAEDFGLLISSVIFNTVRGRVGRSSILATILFKSAVLIAPQTVRQYSCSKPCWPLA